MFIGGGYNLLVDSGLLVQFILKYFIISASHGGPLVGVWNYLSLLS